MPPQVNLQTFERRQKKSGGLGRILGAGLGQLAGKVAGAVGGAVSKDVAKLDDKVTGGTADKLATANAAGQQAVATGGQAAVGLGIVGNSTQGAAGAAGAIQNMSPQEQHQQFLKAEESLASQPISVQKNVTKDVLAGHFALLQQNPELIQANLQQPGLAAAPAGAPGVASAFSGGGVPVGAGGNPLQPNLLRR